MTSSFAPRPGAPGPGGSLAPGWARSWGGWWRRAGARAGEGHLDIWIVLAVAMVAEQWR